MTVELHLGDCLDILPTIESESVDCVITDSPYPYIKRDYGYWTTEEWWALIVDGVIPEVRRILKPTGSAVFILQPNSEHVGQMRGWLWEFMAWVCREWNMVQDVYWWNDAAMPTTHCRQDFGLMRPSVKTCVWAGPRMCYRNQDAILIDEAARTRARNHDKRLRLGRIRDNAPSGHGINLRTIELSSNRRGGVSPFNCLPIGANSVLGNSGHGAGTPHKLADWWVRYICPPGGTVLDPFDGVGTMMLAALQNGCNGIGIERDAGYHGIAQERVNEAQTEMIQSELPVAKL